MGPNKSIILLCFFKNIKGKFRITAVYDVSAIAIKETVDFQQLQKYVTEKNHTKTVGCLRFS
jgi:hypothetical protein